MEIKLRKGKPRVPVYQYEKDGRYFAQIADDIKEAGAEELSELGAESILPAYRGLYFKADRSVMYRINYQSRLISRCLAPLISFSCPDTETLYSVAKQIRWEDFLSDGSTFAISANVANSAITHSQYASLRLKDAVAD
ncbi:MAG: THUMP domain-containing protein [Desulfobacterales bacterium]|nr:THUMP domain-containing protein [Desulfobacterales bacterium]